MEQVFPRTKVENISLPRMLIGTNWLCGYSHTGPAADRMIIDYHSGIDSIVQVLKAYLHHGIDAVMGPCFDTESLLDRAVSEAEQQTGRRIIRIDTPVIDVSDSARARREAEKRIRLSAQSGCAICLPHHSSVEQLVSKHSRTIDRLPDYLGMIRQAGMVPGLSAHMPELVVYSDANGYDVQTYVQLYNCLGFLMQVEVEQVYRIIWNAQKPVMTIKSMAAGRVSPFVGLSFSYGTLRDCDMVTVGAFTPGEVHEDVEIALAAMGHRQANLAGRSSPNTRTAVLEK